ncbi:hypothetical protein TrCOL_g8939 [Triparma columacea]|uniref:Uncharacterized protein n=1 Tax=Triparma columacea TaxID=722753 RepID=A0A9W7GIV3_9STRA|nr:hypothetical protein TrCOL_g8939 [Triparma columacea]
MYSGKALAEQALAASERQALQMRAFSRVIGSQLDAASLRNSEVEKNKKGVDSEEVYKAKLEREREKAQRKGGKKLSAAHLKMAQETGLSGAVVARMMGVDDDDDDVDSDSGSSSSSSGSDSESSEERRKRRKKDKKKRKKSKKDKKKRKKEKKGKKYKKEKRKRDRGDEEDERKGEGREGNTGSDEGNEGNGGGKKRKKVEGGN